MQQFRESQYMLLIDSFLFSSGVCYMHSALLPKYFPKAAFPTPTIPVRKQEEWLHKEALQRAPGRAGVPSAQPGQSKHLHWAAPKQQDSATLKRQWQPSCSTCAASPQDSTFPSDHEAKSLFLGSAQQAASQQNDQAASGCVLPFSHLCFCKFLGCQIERGV